MKFQIIPILLILFISCSERQSAFESTIPTNLYKTKSFYSKNIVQRRTTPSLGSSKDTTVVGNRIFKDENGADFYNTYTRTFFEFSFKDAYIDKSSGIIVNRIINDIQFIIRVDKSININDQENSGLNQNLKLKLVNEPFAGDTVFRNFSGYWSSHRNSEAIENGTTITDLAETAVQSGSTTSQEYIFTFSKELYSQSFLNSDTIANIKALLLDGVNLSGSIRLDTLPYLKITYLNEDDSTITDKLYATSGFIWNSYTYLGNDINSDYSIRSGGREALVFEFDRDEIVNFLNSVIPFGANFSFKTNSLSSVTPKMELRQVTAYDNTQLNLYNDGLDYGPTFTAGFYKIKKIENDDRLINESTESAPLVSSVLSSWSGDNKLNGKILLERTDTKRPAIIKFAKPIATDTLYRLNIYYIDREVN